MKPESLHALIIDHHFGELSPEAAELLELHLAQNVAARAEAERIRTTLSITNNILMTHPELVRVAPAIAKEEPPHGRRTNWFPWMARVAAALAFAATAAAGGYLAGRSSHSIGKPMIASTAMTPPPSESSPWARYQVNFDPSRNSMSVVRVDHPVSQTP